MQINDYGLFFVFWNIFLALIPCGVVYFLTHHKKLSSHFLSFWPLFFIWFFFYPNTAYLFFMVRHLVDYCPDYDTFRVCSEGSWVVFFFFTYALTGLPTFYYALNQMTRLLSQKWGRGWGAIFPVIMIPLTSVGLLFGLYERFNSWDIIKRPQQIFQTIFDYIRTPFLREDFIVFTLLLCFIYCMTSFLLYCYGKS